MARIHRWETDPTVQHELVENGGFCSRHAAALLSMGSPMSVSAIAGFISEWFAERLDGKNLANISNMTCYLCSVSHQTANSAFAEIEAGLNSAAFRADYEESAGLCLPHLRDLMADMEREDIRQFLIEATSRQLSRLAGWCSSYREKRQRLLRHQITLDEKWAWLIAVEKLFGHEEAIRLP